MPNSFTASLGLASFAEALGEAIGRGVARGINMGLAPSAVPSSSPAPAPAPLQAPRRRGRPPKALAGTGKAKCSVSGCPNPVRSKGLCSRHYQAARRNALGK